MQKRGLHSLRCTKCLFAGCLRNVFECRVEGGIWNPRCSPPTDALLACQRRTMASAAGVAHLEEKGPLPRSNWSPQCTSVLNAEGPWGSEATGNGAVVARIGASASQTCTTPRRTAAGHTFDQRISGQRRVCGLRVRRVAEELGRRF